MQNLLILFIPGVLGGMINAIAGGGGILLYPGLLAAGLSPLTANATSSMVALSGSAMSVYGFKQEFKRIPKLYIWLFIPCFIGSIIGCFILVNTASTTFEKLAPWLVLSSVILLAVQSRLHRWLSKRTKKRKLHWLALPIIGVGVFGLAIYGGFFGVGFGLMMLALLGFTALKDIHQINGIKNLYGAAMSLVATIYFAQAGLLNYKSGLIMSAGAALGGFIGARTAKKVSPHIVHDLTVVIGLIISAVLIIKA